MKLRDWILESGYTQCQFAKEVKMSRCHLSNVIRLTRKPSKRFADLIELATGGDIMAYEVLDLSALGYEGGPRRIRRAGTPSHPLFSPRPPKRYLSKNLVSLL